MELVYIAVLGLVVWYAGASINSMIQASAVMAEKEFKSFNREQDIRLHKVRANQTARVSKLADLDVMSDKEFNEFFSVINKDLDKE